MEKTTTIHGMTPVELAKCRENLRQQWESRQVDEDLLKRAWKVAHHMAAVLYQDYGATKVAVFGSLTIPMLFNEHSDIDIVVWDIPDNEFCEARRKIDCLSKKNKIDLIDIKHAKGLIRERIKEQSINIKKVGSDVNTMISRAYSDIQVENHDYCAIIISSFIKRIKDEYQTIQDTVNEIKKSDEDIKDAPTKCRIYIQKVITWEILKVYKGIESIFIRIAREVDMYQPPGSEYPNDPAPLGSEWAYDLIQQMGERRSTRPAVISLNIVHRLKDSLKFYAYYVDDPNKHELIFEKVEQHAKEICQLYEDVSKELDAFTIFLSDT